MRLPGRLRRSLLVPALDARPQVRRLAVESETVVVSAHDATRSRRAPRSRKLSSLPAASQSAAADASRSGRGCRPAPRRSIRGADPRRRAPRGRPRRSAPGPRVAIEREETVTSVGVEADSIGRGRSPPGPARRAARGGGCPGSSPSVTRLRKSSRTASRPPSCLVSNRCSALAARAPPTPPIPRCASRRGVLLPVEQLGERVLHERQGAGLLGDVGGDLGDEGGLDGLADRARRPDDRPLELVGRERVTTSVQVPAARRTAGR